MPIETLSLRRLRAPLSPRALDFTDTSTLTQQTPGWIGQQRAEEAARFGLRMHHADCHVIVVGSSGRGRTTQMLRLVQEAARERPPAPDLCFVHNFERPQHPQPLQLPSGQGRLFRQLMAQCVRDLCENIPAALASPHFLAARERVTHAWKERDAQEFALLQAEAAERNFSLAMEEGHITCVLHDETGAVIDETQLQTMDERTRMRIRNAEEGVRQCAVRYLEASRVDHRAMREAIAALIREVALPVVDRALQAVRHGLRSQIKDAVALADHLQRVRQAVLERVALFVRGDADKGNADDEQGQRAERDAWTALLHVHVAVDHHGAVHAPVVLEDSPGARRLFGGVDHQWIEGEVRVDFSGLRAGSLMRAHGGYLLLDLDDLMEDEQAWRKMQRFVRSGCCPVEEATGGAQPANPCAIDPEPVALQVKLVWIASHEAHAALLDSFEPVARRFPYKVDVADTLPLSHDSCRASAAFVAQTCHAEALPHFSAAAVGMLIAQSRREAQDRHRQSANFARLRSLAIEAATLAHWRSAPQVQPCDVDAARQARARRHGLPLERLCESVRSGERAIDLVGRHVARLNSLTVVDLGDQPFGYPVRVSARTHAGEDGLLNIEREVDLSGPVHDKAVLVLQSHLGSLFAHVSPLAFNASLSFEQEYDGVEGDSASCAEFCVLLSSLSGLALDQGIGVTGAITPHGELLPVGCVNEKIEGFFHLCKAIGLTGTQGVVIPRRNLHHLMLGEEVLRAVRARRFQVHVADTACEVMSLLCGVQAGVPGGHGYPPHTVLGRVQQTLLNFRAACDRNSARHVREATSPRSTGATR